MSEQQNHDNIIGYDNTIGNDNGIIQGDENKNKSDNTQSLNTNSFNTYNIYNITEQQNQYKQMSEKLKEKPRDPMDNGSKRSILKQRADNKQNITIYGLIVGIYEEDWEDVETGEYFTMLTMININHAGKFVADHIQLKMPYQMFENYMIGCILGVTGEAYNYISHGKEKQSIEVKKICKIYDNRKLNIETIVNNLELYTTHLDDENYFKELKKKYYSDSVVFNKFYNLEILTEMIDNMIDIKGFISSYIINQYLINSNPEIINSSLKEQLKSDDSLASDISLIILYIIYKIRIEEIKTLTDIFTTINACLNGIHLMNDKYINVIDKRKCNELINEHKKFKNITCENLNLIPDKALQYVMDRNSNFDSYTIPPMEIVHKAFTVLWSDNFYELLELYQVEL